MKFGWKRLNAEYAEQFGVEGDGPTPDHLTGGIVP